MEAARPTLRTLTEDLKLPVPPLDDLLDEIDHPLLVKARDQFAQPNTAHERIRAVDDEVLFKVKIQRWRGAVWAGQECPWLVAGGWREDGSGDDFYEALKSEALAARKRYNAEHAKPAGTATYVGDLLPQRDDYLRLQAEAGTRVFRRLQAATRALVRASLRDGREHTSEFATFTLGIQVRADHGHETYAAVRIFGKPPADLARLILRHMPGCDPAGWFPEVELPERDLLSGEQAWSNLMDPTAAAKLLNEDDTGTTS
jgi:hypothetical protein